MDGTHSNCADLAPNTMNNILTFSGDRRFGDDPASDSRSHRKRP